MNYVLSDIHGRYDLYNKMLKKIKFSGSDTLYIIGDVIDRGRDGIKILKDIMSRKNIILLIGNHEDMMFQSVGRGECYDESGRMQVTEEFKVWFYNGGRPTLEEFMKLKAEEKKEMLEYLKKCPVCITDLHIGNKKFYLVHASPHERLSMGTHFYRDYVDEEEILQRLLWKRIGYIDGAWEKFKLREGTELIIGHTPTVYFTPPTMDPGDDCRIFFGQNFTAIDCGAGWGGKKTAKLGCLRLEDAKEFYV